MLVTADPVRVTVCTFLGRGAAYRDDLHIEGQVDTCQRVIDVHVDIEFTCLDDRGRTGSMFTAQRDELSGMERLLPATVYLFAGHPLLSLGITSSIGLLVRYGDRQIIAPDLADKRILQGQQNSTLTVQAEHRVAIFRGFDLLSLSIVQVVMEGHDHSRARSQGLIRIGLMIWHARFPAVIDGWVSIVLQRGNRATQRGTLEFI